LKRFFRMGFSNWRLFYVGLGDTWPRTPVDTRSDTKDPPTVNAQMDTLPRCASSALRLNST
jgi:hypothetical protein